MKGLPHPMIWRSQTASFLFFTLVSLKTGISGCGSPFLIFLYRRSCVDTSTSEKSFTLRIHLTIEITRILRQRLKSQEFCIRGQTIFALIFASTRALVSFARSVSSKPQVSRHAESISETFSYSDTQPPTTDTSSG